MNVLSSIDAKELTVTETADELWYKDAIIYQLHVKAFADSNNDGIGDFAGLTEKLGYLQDLGVTALWLLPFYPSPGRDDGYDIADYGDINPDFGTMKDFQPLHPGSQEARPARHHRARRQPHLRPARLVQARPPQRPASRARATGMSGATPTRNIWARGSSSPTPRSRTGPGIPKPASSTGTASSRTSRTSTSTIRAWSARSCR